MIYVIHCKNLCKYSNVPPISTTIIIKTLGEILKNCKIKHETPLRVPPHRKIL
jgi:hypothetical protein